MSRASTTLSHCLEKVTNSSVTAAVVIGLISSRRGLMLRPVICMTGAGAAEIFYSDRFTRVGAMPITVLKLPQDFGSVHPLDGAEHRHCKSMFMLVGRPDEADRLTAHFSAEWMRRLQE